MPDTPHLSDDTELVKRARRQAAASREHGIGAPPCFVEELADRLESLQAEVVTAALNERARCKAITLKHGWDEAFGMDAAHEIADEIGAQVERLTQPSPGVTEEDRKPPRDPNARCPTCAERQLYTDHYDVCYECGRNVGNDAAQPRIGSAALRAQEPGKVLRLGWLSLDDSGGTDDGDVKQRFCAIVEWPDGPPSHTGALTRECWSGGGVTVLPHHASAHADRASAVSEPVTPNEVRIVSAIGQEADAGTARTDDYPTVTLTEEQTRAIFRPNDLAVEAIMAVGKL